MDAPVKDVMGDDGALGALRKLQDEGVVGYVGAAMNDPVCNADYIETGTKRFCSEVAMPNH